MIVEPEDLPEDWSLVPLGELGEYKGGATPRRSEDRYWTDEDGVPWVSSKDMKVDVIHDSQDHVSEKGIDESNLKVFPPGSIFIVTRSGILEHSLPVAVTETEATINQDLKGFIPADPVDPRYLLYTLKASEKNILHECSKKGTTVPSVRTDALFDYPVPVPPREEQKRIVREIEKHFSRLEDGTSLLRRSQQNLTRYRDALLTAAFSGDLSPKDSQEPSPDLQADSLIDTFRKERRRLWNTYQEQKAKAREQSRSTSESYHQSSKQDRPQRASNPEIPPNWAVTRLGQIAFTKVGYAFPSEAFEDDGIRLLRGQNIEPGSLRWEEVEYWNPEDTAPYEHLRVQEGSIILAMDRPIISSGLKIGIAQPEDLPCLLVQRVAEIQVGGDTLRDWIYLALNRRDFISYLAEGQTGTQIPHISKSQINDYPIPIPPRTELDRLINHLEQSLSQCQRYATTISTSQTRAKLIRHAILHDAVTGQLTTG